MIDSVDTVCVNGVKPDEPIILTETFKKADKTLNEPHIHKFGRTRAYVKIEDGCGNKCSYCIIPKLRGGVRYKPADEVYAEISELADNGCAEVSLIGIEISSYPSLPDLVKKLDKISGIKRIRLGSLDPSYIKPQIADGLFASGKIMPHFHLSAQCGSDRILALMRRRYTAETIINNIRYLRSRRPETNISFDIIVGFPSETDSDFSDTAELIKLTAPLHTHIFTFSPREGTEAAVMQGQIPESEKIKRSAALAEIQAGIKRTIYDAALNKSEPLSVLFESFNAGSGIVTGHTPNFLEVSVSGEKSLCGMIHSVRPLGLQPKKENIYGEIIK
jgi:threonylcarbamoyladenosine tRNA methylthiotransferase MtaB